MSQSEKHLIAEQEAKRKKEAKENIKSFFLQWKEAIDRIDLKGNPGIKEEKEGSEED